MSSLPHTFKPVVCILTLFITRFSNNAEEIQHIIGSATLTLKDLKCCIIIKAGWLKNIYYDHHINKDNWITIKIFAQSVRITAEFYTLMLYIKNVADEGAGPKPNETTQWENKSLSTHLSAVANCLSLTAKTIKLQNSTIYYTPKWNL